MNVTFHALTAVAIAHIAAIRLDPSREGWFYRSDVWALGSAITLGVLSHGVLDGLKHGYPLETMPDVLCAGVLAGCWCLCVRRRYFLLFTSVSLASFFPDIVDLGPRMLRSATGIWTPMLDAAPLFPGIGPMDPDPCTRCWANRRDQQEFLILAKTGSSHGPIILSSSHSQHQGFSQTLACSVPCPPRHTYEKTT
jgi:hypothetical protein